VKQNKFNNFKADVRAGLSVDLLSELYDLPLPEVRKGLEYINRSWEKRLYSSFKQLFRNIVFQAKIKFTILKIQRLLKRGD
jgi:hypothetical protein